MTLEQWKLIRPGDVLVDNAVSRSLRKVFAVKRVKGKRGQGLHMRTVLTVNNLKSNGQKTHIFCSDYTGPLRFDFPVTIK